MRGKPKEDLTGKTFDRLFVERLATLEEINKYIKEPVNSEDYWLCQCSCGNTTVKHGSYFRNTVHSHKSCGCWTPFKDITGKRFGKLTVVRQATQQEIADIGMRKDVIKENRSVWVCQCDCGNVVIKPATELVSGHTRSCGCLTKRFAKELTGQTFGMLHVIRRASREDMENFGCPYDNKHRQAKWICHCDGCGNDVILSSSNLTSGNYKSCGCGGWEKKKRAERVAELTGKRFGHLVLVEPLYQQRGDDSKHLGPRWKCLCDCGNYVVKYESDLLKGQATSCKECTAIAISESSSMDLTGLKFGKLTVIKRDPEYIDYLRNKKDKTEFSHKSKWVCKCDCGNTISVIGSHLTAGKKCSCGCDGSGISVGEALVSQYLDEHNIRYEYQKKYKDLLGKRHMPLSYDFYLPEDNLLIEFQGRQHYAPSKFSVKVTDEESVAQFMSQQEHDSRKREYAKQHNIKLLEIRYDQIDQINDILDEHVNLAIRQ